MTPRQVLAALVFCGVAAGVVGLTPIVARFWFRRHVRVRDRLAREFGTPAERVAAEPTDLVFLADPPAPGDGRGWGRRFAEMVHRSGLGITAGQLVAGCVGAAAVLGGLGWAWRHHLPTAGAGAVAGAVAPLLYVRARRRAADERLLNQLPEVLDLMARYLRSGHGLPQAMRAVATEFRPPVGDLFARFVTRQDFGLPADAALQELGDRAGLPEYRIFVLAVQVQMQTGGSLADVCDRLARDVRERLRVRAMIRGLTAEGRMQANILTALPVAVFLGLWVVKRSYADAMLARPALLLAIVASQVVGILWIRRIIRPNF